MKCTSPEKATSPISEPSNRPITTSPILQLPTTMAAFDDPSVSPTTSSVRETPSIPPAADTRPADVDDSNYGPTTTEGLVITIHGIGRLEGASAWSMTTSHHIMIYFYLINTSNEDLGVFDVTASIDYNKLSSKGQLKGNQLRKPRLGMMDLRDLSFSLC